MLTAIGMMSGTSMDGIDVAWLQSDGEFRLSRGPSAFFPYDSALRGRIEAGLALAAGIDDRLARPPGLAQLERDLTLRHVEAISRFRAGLPEELARIDLIGFHGQTVLHRPDSRLTVQLGDGALLARQSGIDVVHDMRAADMMAGGQGAPLVPAYHAALARTIAGTEFAFPIAFVNIGGIANISYIPENGDPIAFDTGPGNMLVDQWVMRHTGARFDEDGRIAAAGNISEAVIAAYLADPFLARLPPKSLDRLDFSLDKAAGLSLADGARTLAIVTARTIFHAETHLPSPPKSWILCGGGRRNPHIVTELERLGRERSAAVLSADALDLNGDAVEAEAWAYLAIRARHGLPLTFPTTTGCQKAVTGGVLARAQDGSTPRGRLAL